MPVRPQGLESLYKAICARYNAEEAKEPQELPETRPVAQEGSVFFLVEMVDLVTYLCLSVIKRGGFV